MTNDPPGLLAPDARDTFWRLLTTALGPPSTTTALLPGSFNSRRSVWAEIPRPELEED